MSEPSTVRSPITRIKNYAFILFQKIRIFHDVIQFCSFSLKLSEGTAERSNFFAITASAATATAADAATRAVHAASADSAAS